jgi:hypothetical protein
MEAQLIGFLRFHIPSSYAPPKIFMYSDSDSNERQFDLNWGSYFSVITHFPAAPSNARQHQPYSTTESFALSLKRRPGRP